MTVLPGVVAGTAARLGIVHSTGFRYPRPVVTSYNEARMTPLTTPWQTTLEARLEVSPQASTYRYWDYWGTQVTAFDVRPPHDRLTVTARSVVETFAPPAPTGTDVGWEALRGPAILDRYAELLAPTPRTEPGEPALAQVRDLVAGLDPVASGERVCTWVSEVMDYVPGATGVHTSAEEAWEVRKGVCQDMAHVAVGVLRRLGVPARYVSGYLLPQADLPLGETVRGESHAWVEWWAGEWQIGRASCRERVLLGV